MANWVREILEANPDLAALPVAKRARRSLHLRRPDGRILGLFTGSPCHYQDEGGQWQPLDTMPLYDMGRGLWYCPGLNVVITSEGVVRLGDYSQWTKRIGLFRPSTMELLATRDVPLGNREGDALVAERDEWRVERRITATGYRELLTLKVRPDIPQAQVGDFLVLETLVGGVTLPNGWVDGQYNISEHWSPMPVAWDANDEPLTCRRYWRDGVLYTGIPVTELAHADYPITIDPDFAGSTADGYIRGYDTDTYAAARSTSDDYVTNSSTTLICGQTAYFACYRGFLKFDTSGIGAGQNILQDNLNMTVKTNISTTDFDVQIVKQDWSAQDPLSDANREAAYDNCLAGTEDDSIWRNTAGIATNTNYTSGNLDVTYPDPEGITYYSLRSSLDKAATEPSGDEYLIFYPQENATAAYRPYLTILYEAAGGVDVTVDAVLATATAASLIPTVTGGATISGILATATAAGLVPVVSGGSGATVSGELAEATAAGLVPVVSGGTGTTVSAVLAEAIAAALLPIITGGALVTGVLAEAAAAGLVPTVTGGIGATVSGELAEAVAAGLVPVVTGGTGATVTAVLAEAIAAALLPTITGGATISGVLAEAVAAVLVASVTGGTGATVSAVLAEAAAAGLIPTVTGGALVSGQLATATAAGLVPVVTGGTGATVNAVLAEAVAAALLPTVTGGATVSAEIATAIAEALVPVITGAVVGGVTVYATVAEAIATALAPIVTGGLGVTVSAALATALAEALVPRILTLFIQLTLDSRSTDLTLESRSFALTLEPRSFALTLPTRE